jgi:sec-independent protein translocase protein TatA
MFGVGLPELIIIMVIAPVVFGAGRLPEVGSALGKGIRDFKGSFDDEDDVKKVDPKSEPPQT